LLVSPDFRLPTAVKQPQVTLLEASTGKPVKVLHTAKDSQVVARWHPNGRAVFIRAHGQPGYLLDMESGEKLATFDTPFAADLVSSDYLALFSADGKFLLEAALGLALLWDAVDGNLLWALPDVASDDGPHPGKTSGDPLALRKSLAKNEETRKFVANSVRDIPEWSGLAAFSADGQRVVLAGILTGSTTTVRETASGKQVCKLHGHQDVVTRVAFSPDGKWVASAGKDNSVRIWYAHDGKEYLTLPHSDPVAAICFSGDSKHIHIVTEYASFLGEASTRPLCLLPLAAGLADRELTPEERELYGTGPAGTVKPAPLVLPLPALSLGEEWRWHFNQARVLAKAGQAQQAKKLLDKIRTLLVSAKGFWTVLPELAAVRLGQLGDVAGYRQDCLAALSQLDHGAFGAFETVAMACCLAPDAVPDLASLAQQAKDRWSVEPDKSNPERMKVLGALHYRAGQYAQAVQALDETLELRQPKGAQPWELIFLAMAHQRQGDQKKALTALEQARKIWDANSYPWLEQMEIQIVLDEAQKLIKPAQKNP
jgi:tetratricopeptide (TPR) repeat protein